MNVTKQFILDCFKDINDKYNNPNTLDSLSQLLDEFVEEKENQTKENYEQGHHDGYVQAMSEQPEIIRCKDCERRGDPKMCMIAFIAKKQDMPVFFYDNRGEWFCGDGKRKEG